MLHRTATRLRPNLRTLGSRHSQQASGDRQLGKFAHHQQSHKLAQFQGDKWYKAKIVMIDDIGRAEAETVRDVLDTMYVIA